MNKLAIAIIVGALIIFGGSLLIDTRLAPFIGAAFLAIGIIYATIRNKTAGKANLEKAERATRRRQEERAGRTDTSTTTTHSDR